ncbi:colipase-like protein 1 [Marmota monax]|uniref:colipase-like protein 1 n=1 Tax=Marmota monax TaxID=9995 RepID=UPI0026F230DF|nr:colipase-like protein 1 [Marmota monax]
MAAAVALLVALLLCCWGRFHGHKKISGDRCSHHSECFSDCCLMDLTAGGAFCAPKARKAMACLPQENGNICFRNQGCKSGCCRKADDNCESHCTMMGSEGSKCQTQIFFGLYKECPCHSNLTCIFPKNQKTFKLIYGSCEKYVNQKTLEKTWF